MAKTLEPYHFAWLSDNPDMDAFELMMLLKRGFDIHHLDGDHTNNQASNLILIWAADHMMLHNGKKRMSRVAGVKKNTKKSKKATERVSRADCGCVITNNVFVPCVGSPFRITKHSRPRRVIKNWHEINGLDKPFP